MVAAYLAGRLGEGPVQIGELTLEGDEGRYLVRGPGPPDPAVRAPSDPEAFRAWVRTTEDGHYRPLSGIRSLRRGWQVVCRDLAALVEVVELVYPMALDHLQQAAEGRLRITPLPEVLARQTGRDAIAANAPTRGRTVACGVLCGLCVRAPVWQGGLEPGSGAIPCPEPCSVLVSLCREMAAWEVRPPLPGRPDPEAGFADFSDPGNPVRVACLRELAP